MMQRTCWSRTSCGRIRRRGKRAVQRTLRTAKEAVRMAALDCTRPLRRAMGIGRV